MRTKILPFLFLAISLCARAGTDDIYKFKWLDPDKKVFVLQNKIHQNANSFYINFGYGSNNLSDFQDSKVIHGNIGYYFAEEWAFELFYSSVSNDENDSYNAISEDINDIPYVIKMDSAYGGLLVFSPFYGKINTFNTIFYLDWSFGAGIAKINFQDNYDSFIANLQRNSYSDKSETAFVAKTQFRFFLTEHVLFNFDFFNYFFQSTEPAKSTGNTYDAGKDKWTRAYDFIFSLGLTF